jgi:acetyl-CoA carboxylase biotin carboxyl carrier protein
MAILELKTDITGSVWKIVKAVGDRVEEDEPLLIMESMKMEIPVTSPEAGVVTEVLVKEGDTVGDGTVVARVEV